MFKELKKKVKGHMELDVSYSLLSTQEESKSLAIMLPGTGYTVLAPFLLYSTGVFVNNSYDLLQVNYQYNQEPFTEYSTNELSEVITYDVRTVLDSVLNERHYDHFCFIGKSLGTIAMSSELKRDIFKDAGAIWLTPLLHRDDVMDTMVNGRHRGLCFIGDQDSIYTNERFQQLKSNPNLMSKLIPGVNHGLTCHDPVDSIDVLRNVINDITHFVIDA
ncbi:hypothetical protein JOC77_000907 [Peribacillus deserti]|uniref:Alpha/beta hydrolase n=1 Tax=Peribacillus deserti TaxID=673318 RepID=A0ABS2QEB4_9BACI|nr:alpha/beta hydrolase [Peribacillus deserti]MBM7691502.1 hypothetical protein [Peribacillus deserti]